MRRGINTITPAQRDELLGEKQELDNWNLCWILLSNLPFLIFSFFNPGLSGRRRS